MQLGPGGGLWRHLLRADPRNNRNKYTAPVPTKWTTFLFFFSFSFFSFFLLSFLPGAVFYSGYIKTPTMGGESMVPRVVVTVPTAIPGTGSTVSPALTASSNISRTIATALPKIPKSEHPPRVPLPHRSCRIQATDSGCPPPPPAPAVSDSIVRSCPEYFRWIHEDLRPWRKTGVTEEMVKKANKTANFRLLVVGGRAYVEHYRKSFQSRDEFTLWGIVQLLRRYAGRIPDVDLMFDCVDWPIVRAVDYRPRQSVIGSVASKTGSPPPLFRYCGDDMTLDIVFPDWSFWGWPEINIKPWVRLSKELKEGNKRMTWIDREPYAYWKGNPVVATERMELLKCNVSGDQDWNARLFAQDWRKESRQGFKQSNLGRQCHYRYKIYVEGSAWSVSQKYIMACDSPALVVTPRYYDFFTRGLMPLQHYWPVRTDDKCRSIKFAVDWGNRHKKKAQAIGKESSRFVLDKLRMDHVYDYMFHLLREYSKLMRYRPTVPPGAVELCAESMACGAEGLTKKFMKQSMVNFSMPSSPCALPPPFGPAEMKSLLRRKANRVKQVEIWERQAFTLRPNR